MLLIILYVTWRPFFSYFWNVSARRIQSALLICALGIKWYWKYVDVLYIYSSREFNTSYCSLHWGVCIWCPPCSDFVCLLPDSLVAAGDDDNLSCLCQRSVDSSHSWLTLIQYFLEIVTHPPPFNSLNCVRIQSDSSRDGFPNCYSRGATEWKTLGVTLSPTVCSDWLVSLILPRVRCVKEAAAATAHWRYDMRDKLSINN